MTLHDIRLAERYRCADRLDEIAAEIVSKANAADNRDRTLTAYGCATETAEALRLAAEEFRRT